MAYAFSAGGDPGITATALVTGIFDQVRAAFIEKKYPAILWRDVIPPESVITDINPGAANYIYRVHDIKGVGNFVRGNPNNIPRVGQVIGQVTVPILDAAVGSIVTNGEARRYALGFGGGQSALAKDLGEVMRKAADYHVERAFFFGDVGSGFLSFLDYSTVPIITPVTAWTGADPSVWVGAVNDWITTVWTGTKTVHLPNTVFLPPAKYAMLQQGYVVGEGGTGVAVSALKYLRENNIYTAERGQPLNIRPLRYLEGAGSGGVDRAIVMEGEPDNMLMPFPMVYQLAQPVPGPLSVEIFAEYVFGSFNMPFPQSMAYADGL